ncbi:fibronectin binding repeat family protein, partial [Streptococcus pyogenes MGAS2111]
VLFSQGESTFSYDIKDKSDNKVAKTRITEKVTTSNPLLPWPPIFNHTNQNTDMLDDFAKLVTKLKSLGLGSLETADSILKALRATSQFGSIWGKSLTEYLTLYEYDSDKLDEKSFDYAKHVGEGYYYHSFSERTHEDTMPLETAIKTALTSYFPQFPTNWFSGILNSFVEKDKVEKVKLDVIMQVLRSIFYKREYRYYNHNRSAIAEAKMAQKDGITFYSVDVTSPNQSANKRIRRSAATPEEKRNEKFDNYLKQMSEGGKEFFTDVDKADKFKDTLTELTIKDEFADKVTVQKDSKGKEYHKTSLSETPTVNHTAAATIKSFFSNSTTKESLTWTISKEQLKKAFEDGKPLTLTYKLKVDNNKFKTALDSKKRTKRDTPTENENSVTEKIISNTITYTINNQKGQTDKKLDEVSLTYSKFKVPVPQIDGQVIEPQAPKLPDLPPVIERGPVLDYTEESIYRLPLEHGSNAPDTQVTIEEDTVPQRPDILVGGQSGPVDITEDTQPGMSAQMTLLLSKKTQHLNVQMSLLVVKVIQSISPKIPNQVCQAQMTRQLLRKTQYLNVQISLLAVKVIQSTSPKIPNQACQAQMTLLLSKKIRNQNASSTLITSHKHQKNLKSNHLSAYHKLQSIRQLITCLHLETNVKHPLQLLL